MEARFVIAIIRRSADGQGDAVAFEGGAVVEGELFQGDVIVSQGADFGGARGGEIVLQLQDGERRAFADRAACLHRS